MHITAMTHRDALFDLTLRWLNDDFQPEDPPTVSRIFLYESIVARCVVDRMTAFLGKLFKSRLHAQRLRQKHLLRERLIHYLPHQSSRTRQLIAGFRENPEYFFPGLPIDAALLTTPDGRLAAIGRIKRLSRVAEKVSHRLVAALLQEIRAEAQLIAERRAAAVGVPLAQLISSEEVMGRDFAAAETAVAGLFRHRNVRIAREALAINDLVGFKIIAAPDVLERVPALLEQEPYFTVVETEKHSGDYNAVNLLVDVDLPAPETLAALQQGFDWSIAARRGLDPGRTQAGFADYLARGARVVRLEAILTTYDELMESELGRSMHELRVLRLRQRQAYSGLLAQNAGYLVEYLLTLAVAPTSHLTKLPVKMYGRYLPETIAAAKWALFGNEIESGLLTSFCLNAAAGNSSL